MSFIPKIFDSATEGELPALPDFNAVKIRVDGRAESDLKWGAQMKTADSAKNLGLKIFWEIDLGLFSNLPLPLEDESQTRMLKLSLDHFKKEIWEKYGDQSLGLAVYRGSADFTLHFPLDNEAFQEWLAAQVFQQEVSEMQNLYCRDVCVDYLDFICQDLPDSLPLFILLDATSIKNESHLAQILSRERFQHFHLAIKGGSLPIEGLAWEDPRTAHGFIAKKSYPIQPQELANIAICLPSRDKNPFLLEKAIREMNRRSLHYRIIPESFLTMEWEGLDYLIVIKEALSDLGLRKLQGFSAAGGTVVTIGGQIGLPYEVSFDHWTEKLLEIL